MSVFLEYGSAGGRLTVRRAGMRGKGITFLITFEDEQMAQQDALRLLEAWALAVATIPGSGIPIAAAERLVDEAEQATAGAVPAAGVRRRRWRPW